MIGSKRLICAALVGTISLFEKWEVGYLRKQSEQDYSVENYKRLDVLISYKTKRDSYYPYSLRAKATIVGPPTRR